jgi:acetylornithine deacetylase/succinyl-diaminopimelate desuccinylase-like protein
MTSTTPTDAALDRIDADLDAALERLFRLVRFQSVSTDPAYATECRKAADWLAGDLAAIGFDVRIAETPGHPIVVGHHAGPRGGERAPHLLFYGHYDVQPVDPIGLWQGDPFAPELRSREDGSRYIHGRGAADDKGQLMTFVEACRAWKAATGALPCRVSVLIEGEEESGGASLPAFLDEHRDELAADIALICDTGMFDVDTPAITTMLRGNVADQVTIHAASRDLHSGMYGGAAQNPIHVLTRILAAMHGDDGRIAIPGFYEGVHEVPPAIKAQWDRLGFDAGEFLGAIGLSEPWGRHGYSALEHLWSRPTAEVNGIWGGYTGAGFKTVIPAEASAKVSFRLVGEQDPEHVRECFRAFVRDRLPADCRAEFTGRAGGFATVMPTADPAFEKARRALTEEWGREAAFIGCGGSIPVVGLLKSRLGMDSLLIGFALDDDRMHSPNEKYELTSFHKGARSWARVLGALAG